MRAHYKSDVENHQKSKAISVDESSFPLIFERSNVRNLLCGAVGSKLILLLLAMERRAQKEIDNVGLTMP